MSTPYTALDFFAGSGLVSEGLKPHFNTVWANDNAPRKAAVYTANHPDHAFHPGSIADVRGADLPPATLSWGSFPCQDLSLAGRQGGMGADRSGLVWQWLRVMGEMSSAPPLVVAENVVGLLSSHRGRDYAALHNALCDMGYRVGAMVLDAALWVPQSRRRVFVIAARRDIDIAPFVCDGPQWPHPKSITNAAALVDNWVWWRLPEPPKRALRFEDIVDWDAPCLDDVAAAVLVNHIPEGHRRRLQAAINHGQRAFTAYKRTRNGRQTLELRFDDIAGCLRTPSGGSSRQYVLLWRGGRLHARLLTTGEAARLMGAPHDYKLPQGYQDAYWALGDAVAVPVARFLAGELLYQVASRK